MKYSIHTVLLLLTVACVPNTTLAAKGSTRDSIGNGNGQRKLEACSDHEKGFKLAKNGKKKECSWVERNPEKRCDLKVKNGKKKKGKSGDETEAKFVRDVCSQTCGLCAEPGFSYGECVAGFQALNYNTYNYGDYDKYFDDDSLMVLAQVGSYQGADAIEEYVKYIDDTSPYIDRKMLYNVTLDPAGWNPEEGVCTFYLRVAAGVVLNEKLTTGGTYHYGVGQKVSYSMTKNKIPSVYIYYTNEGFRQVWYELYNTEGVRGFVCDVLTNPNFSDCQEINQQNNNLSKQQCLDILEDLPISEGDGTYVDGNSRSCRAIHAVFAQTNPDHCAHVSLARIADPNGKIVCQESANVSPTDYFTNEEILGLRQFCKEQTFVGSETCSVYDSLE